VIVAQRLRAADAKEHSVQTSEIERLTERLLKWQDQLPWAGELGRIAAAAISELATGEPVEVARLAAAVQLPVDAVDAFLRRSPAEFDRQGRLVGLGLTLRRTAHRLELSGRSLYTWCAGDTLMVPILLGEPARIESPCFATGEIVSVELDADPVHSVTPGTAVVSIVTPDIEQDDSDRTSATSSTSSPPMTQLQAGSRNDPRRSPSRSRTASPSPACSLQNGSAARPCRARLGPVRRRGEHAAHQRPPIRLSRRPSAALGETDRPGRHSQPDHRRRGRGRAPDRGSWTHRD
jgi:hypothetical protein